MLTLTLRHRREDALAGLFKALTAGWAGVVQSAAWTGDRRAGRDGGDRQRFGVAGVVRVVEATASRPDDLTGSGWHVHIHALIFCTEPDFGSGIRSDFEPVLASWGISDPSSVSRAWLGRAALAARIHERWARAVRKAGGRSVGAAGVDLRTIADGGAEFVGRYLEKATYDAARIGAEVAAGDATKTGRGGRLAPFELLHELLTDEDSPKFGLRTPSQWEIVEGNTGPEMVDSQTGELTAISSPGAWRLWHEWELGTKGRRRVRWSNRPRRIRSSLDSAWLEILDARGEEASDEEVAEASIDGAVLGEIPRDAWTGRLVWRPSWLVEILEVAESDGRAGLRRWMGEHGIDWTERVPEDGY